MENAISIKELSVSYSNIDAINNINLEIKESEFVCIIGPNGGGKTTLLNTILGFLKPSHGKIEIFGKPINKAYSQIAFVPQIADADRGFPITVLETVMTAFLKSGLHPFKIFKKEEKEKAEKYLKLVGLSTKVQNKISDLSGGEFQRLLIARALASESEIIILDEPTANVDPTTSKHIFEILKQLHEKGKTIITVTHDLNAATTHATKLVCVKRELVYCGNPEINETIKKSLFTEISNF